MSFSRSKFKRFNDFTTCAPPVGSYDPKSEEKNGVSIGKSDRFKASKDVTPAPNAFDLSTLDVSTCSQKGNLTPAKQQLFHKPSIGTKTKCLAKAKRELSTSCPDLSKQKELEHEIKKLVNEKVEADKCLAQREEEVKKLEAQIQQLQKDRTSLKANIASLDKQIGELTKTNECLKNKMFQNNGHHEKIKHLNTELVKIKDELAKKDKEINGLHHDLDKSKTKIKEEVTSLNDIIADLRDKNTLLEMQNKESLSLKEQMHLQLEEVRNAKEVLATEKTALQNMFVSTEDACKDLKFSLQKELNLKGEALEELNQHKQETIKLRSTFDLRVAGLQEKIRFLTQEKQDDTQMVRHLKGELFAAEDKKKEYKSLLAAAQEEMQQMSTQIKDLEETEEILNCNIRLMSEKYEILENNLGVSELEKKEKIEMLTRELQASRHSYHEKQADCQQLELANKDLLTSLCIEKESRDCLEKQFEDIAKEFENMEVETKNSVKKVEEEKQNVVVELERVKEELSKMNETSQVELTLTRKERDNIQEECEKVKKERENLHINMNNQLDKCQEEKIQAEKQLVDLRAEYDWMHNSLTKELTKIVDEKENLEKEWRNLQDVFSSVEDSTKEKIETLKSQKDELLNKLKNTEDQLEELRNNQRNTEEEKEILKQELEVVKSAHQFEIEKLQSEIEEKNDEINTLIKLKAEVHLTVDESREKIESLEEEKAILLDKIEEISKQKDSLQGDVKELTTRNESLNSDLQKEVIDASLTIDQIRQENKYLKERLQQTKEQLQSTDEMYHNNERKLKEELSKQQEMMAAATEHENNMCRAKAVAEEAKLQIAEECVQLKLKIKNLKDEMENDRGKKLQEECSVLNRKNKEKSDTISKLRLELQDSAFSYNRLNENFTCLKNEKEAIIKSQEEEIQHLKSEHESLRTHLKEIKVQLQDKSSSYVKLMKEFDKERAESKAMAVNADEHIHKLQEEYEKTISKLQKTLEKQKPEVDTAEFDLIRLQAKKWQDLYEELWKKVEPFQEQLDEYEAKKNALLRTSKDAKAELDKLSKDYAKLVGHQNHKQKIQHVIKIKEENRVLREEAAKLREQLDRKNRQMARLNDKLVSLEGKRRFDPAKAFRQSVDKENTPPVSPMKTSNR